MLDFENKFGRIVIDNTVLTNLAGEAANACFGVKGMVACAKDGGPWQLLKRESMSKGVVVRENKDATVDVDLHIGVDRGVNIRAVAQSIMNEVAYKLEQTTGITINSVNVYIDTIIDG